MAAISMTRITLLLLPAVAVCGIALVFPLPHLDRKSTRLNSSHSQISYAVFCLKKKKNRQHRFTYEAGVDPVTHRLEQVAQTAIPPPLAHAAQPHSFSAACCVHPFCRPSTGVGV